jgi:hypothetical protein
MHAGILPVSVLNHLDVLDGDLVGSNKENRTLVQFRSLCC